MPAFVALAEAGYIPYHLPSSPPPCFSAPFSLQSLLPPSHPKERFPFLFSFCSAKAPPFFF